MESKSNEDSTFDSFLYEDDEELNLYQGIMNQNISTQQIAMLKEIKTKQNIINRLFKEKFEKNFFQFKLESLKEFESGLKEYLFSPGSNFLNYFPRLKRKLIKAKKIKEEKLKEKINIGSLLYLSLNGHGAQNNKNINDKFFKMSKNLSSSIAKNILSNALYKAKFEKKNKERLNKILSYRNLRFKNKKNIFNELHLENINNILNEDNKTNKNVQISKSINILNKNKFFSRNRNFSLKKYNATSYSINNDNFLNSFSPYTTFNTVYKRNSSRFYNRQCKVIKKDLNKFVDCLDEKTKLCNNKLIKIINGNRKINLRKTEEKNKEIVNLKKILFDNKIKRVKKRINNIKEIKSLINKAKMDTDGEFLLEKIKKNELKNFGHYINIMSDELVLNKINELYTKGELKKEGKIFKQNELERIKKKREKQLIVEHNRQKIKDNYNKMVKLENDLSKIKKKFNYTNIKTMIKNNNISYIDIKEI